MSRKTITKALRRWLESLGDRCEYCYTSEQITGIALDADHIIPRAKGGLSDRSNLCRACSSCNTNKGDQTEATDPLTSQTIPLFNPRSQHWSEHFAWHEGGAQIIGLTPCGRATIEALKINNPRIVRARQLWISVGWHPPQDELKQMGQD